MTQTTQQKQYMEQHKDFVRVVQFITSFDFLLALQVLKTQHTGIDNKINVKHLYEKVYGDAIYEDMEIPGAGIEKEKSESESEWEYFYALDKSSQFRESFKRFIAIQDAVVDECEDENGKVNGDVEPVLNMFKKKKGDYTEEEWEQMDSKNYTKADFSEEEYQDLVCCIRNLQNIFYHLLGGKVAYTTKSETGTKTKNPQRSYYFIPDADNSKMDFLTGMVMCNPLIAQKEKKELLRCMSVMNPCYRFPLSQYLDDENNKEPKKEEVQLPSESVKFLQHVQTLYTAVANGYQIEIVYGIYDRAENNKVLFRGKKKEKTILNPFALLWDQGHYYLIATTQERADFPRHYRVDRFIEVAIATAGEEDDKKPVPRCSRPLVLENRYFKHDVFLPKKYVQEHPGMRIYTEERLIDCVFELTDWELQMMVDAFGSDLTVYRKGREPKTRIDYNGEERELYLVTVENVQYDNALSFALQHAEYITVRQPQKLVDDVRSKLKKMLEQLN